MKKVINEYLYLVVAFYISRIIFFLCGVRFSCGTIFFYIQLVSLDLLKNDLLRSIFYLHSLPPLFNLFLGLVIKFTSGLNMAFCVYKIIYLYMGVILSLSCLYLMRCVKVYRWLAWVLVLLFMISPAVIQYENLLFYTYPLALFLCLSAVFFYRWASYHRLIDASLFCWSLLVLALTKGIFHLIWFLFFIGVLKYVSPKTSWKNLLRVCLVPLILVSMFYLKNFILFKSISLSETWMGHQMAKMAGQHVPRERLDALLAQGVFSQEMHLSLTSGDNREFLNKISHYVRVPKTGIPVLDREVSPISGLHNWNSLAHLMFAKQQKKVALLLLKKYPLAYLTSVKWAFYDFVFPGPTDIQTYNRKYLQFYEKIWNFMFLPLDTINEGRVLRSDDLRHFNWDRLSRICFGIVIIYYILIVFYGVVVSLKSLFSRNLGDPKNALIFYMTFNVVYVTLVSNIFGYTANNRYRFTIDPFFLILTGMLLTSVLNAVLNRKKIDMWKDEDHNK